MNNIEDIKQWTAAIIKKDEEERNPMWREMERTYHLDYRAPEAAKNIEGYHRVVRPEPYKDILVAKNALLTAKPKIKIEPWNEKFAGQKVANEREQSLKWWLSKLDKRGGNSVQADILESAALYGAVTAQVTHVEYAARAQAEKTGKQARYRKQHGPYAVQVYNPMDVHWQTSLYGLERVVSATCRPVQEVLDTWGDLAKGLRTKLDANKGRDQEWKFKYCYEYYYCDIDTVAVWVVPTPTTAATSATSKDALVILKEENELGFINWVCTDLGSALEKHGRYKHKPLLWYTVQSGSWETACTLASLQMTQGIQNAAKPDWIIEVMDANAMPTFDYKEVVGGAIVLTPGQKVQETAPAYFDQGLATLQQQLANFQSSTGVSEALAGNAQAETFAGQNLLVTTGKASIAGMKSISETALAEICLQMLQWLVKADQPMRAQGMDKPFIGQEYMLNPTEIDPETTYITVELSTENEGTRIQQANVGAIGKQLGLSDETAQEWMGIDNPQAEAKKRALEEFLEFKKQDYFKRKSAQTDMELQQQMLQQQMQAQQEMQMAQQPPQDFGGDASYFEQQPLEPPTPQIGADISGQGYNPAAGGIPPAQVNPGATMEMQTGMTRGGAPIQ